MTKRINIILATVYLLLSIFLFTGIGRTQGIDLPGLTTELAQKVEQQLGAVGGSVYEVRKDAIYLFFSDPSKITLRSRFYIYSASDTSVPPTPTAELEITRLSRQFPAGRISRTFKQFPLRKGDRVVTGPEKVAVLSLGDEGRIQLLSEMLSGQLTASGRYNAIASVELSGLWQKRKTLLYSTAADTVALETVNLDTVIAQQLFRETDYSAILIGHWEKNTSIDSGEDSGRRLVYQIYRYGIGMVQEPVIITLENNVPLYQLLFPATKPSEIPKPEPPITENTTVQSIEKPLAVVAEVPVTPAGPVQLLQRIQLGYQVFGLTAGDIDKDNIAELILFSSDKMKLFKWGKTTLIEKYSQSFAENLPSTRTRDWIRHAMIVDGWQTVIVYHSGNIKSDIYEWKNNQFRLLTQLDHLALGTLRNPDGKTMVIAADLLSTSNLYSGETIYLMYIDPNGTVETQTYSLKSDFYNVAGGGTVENGSPIWFVINENYQLQAYTASFEPIWTSETTYGYGLAVISSKDTTTDIQIVNTSSAVYGNNDTISILDWNKGTPQLRLSYPISGSVTQVAVGDVNGDGKLELILVSDDVVAGKIKSTLLIYQLNYP